MMAFDPRLSEAIMACIRRIPDWERHGRTAAVVLSGSVAAGLSDDRSDIDVEVLLPEPSYGGLYDPFWQAVDKGAIGILNPRARRFHEYPIVPLPSVKGHYRIKAAETIEARIRAMDDVIRWIYGNTHALADPNGLHAKLQELAGRYPPGVAEEKRRNLLFLAKDCFYGLKMQLGRDHWQSICLLSVNAVVHLLKLCCLSDGKPYPYDKWLYRVAVETTLGRRLQPPVDAILAEAGRKTPIREEPDSLVRPGHRNEEFERYRLFHLFLHAFQLVELLWRERFPEESV
jgi:hypothetical protein